MEIRSKASFSASCLHAALCREQGYAAVDGELAEFVVEPAEQLVAAIAATNLAVQPTLSALVSLASEFENNRQLVVIALTRLHGAGSATETTVSQIAAAIGTLEAKLLAARPEMVDELALRGRPLQEQWQARGPGLLREFARLTDEGFLAPAAEIVLVTPWIGGGGRADFKTNRVILEAVLTNPYTDLPEALRLGWLLAQLNADLPAYSDAVPHDRLEQIAKLATLPAILAAAETVEWGTCSPATIERALECWHVESESPPALAEQLFRWWQTYHDGSKTWAVAWRALTALLG